MLEYLWRWFKDIAFDREVGFGVGYIRSSEYEAWARLNRIEMSPAELAVLKKIDRAFVAHATGHGKEEKPSLVAQLGALKNSRTPKRQAKEQR